MAIAAELGLSIAFTLISLAPAIPDWLSMNNQPKLRVQIRTGLPPTEGMNENARKKEYDRVSMGGDVPNVVLFNAAGDRIAYSSNDNRKKMGHNAPTDILATYFDSGNTQTPEYITISASGDDAICITSITVTPPNTQEMWAVVPGEVAAECNTGGKTWPWAYSDASVQISSADGKSKEDVRPKCLWIDGGGEGEHNMGYQGLQVHLPDFKLDNSKWKEWQNQLGQMCDSVARFWVFEKLNKLQCPQKFDPPPKYSGQVLPYPETSACYPDIWHSTPEDDPALSKEEAHGVQCKFNTQKCHNDFLDRKRRNTVFRSPQPKRDLPLAMIWSQDTRVSAVELCNDPASRQDSLYSEREQMFCDMTTHTLLPVCGSGSEACFDPMQNVTRHAGNEKREIQKKYVNVKHWAKL